MGDAPPDTGPVIPDEPNGAATTGTPRWVKVFAVFALLVVALVVVVIAFGGGEHGPGRHTGNGGSGTHGAHTGPPPGVENGDSP